MCTPPSNPFNPPEADIPGVLDDLATADFTMADIASRYGAAVESLARWMARPDIAARLDAIEAAIARRVRLLAVGTLPSAVSVAARILSDFESDSAHLPVNPKSIRDLERRTRAASVARAAATLIARLSQVPTKVSVPLAARPPVGVQVRHCWAAALSRSPNAPKAPNDCWLPPRRRQTPAHTRSISAHTRPRSSSASSTRWDSPSRPCRACTRRRRRARTARTPAIMPRAPRRNECGSPRGVPHA